MAERTVWTEERLVEPYQGDFRGHLHLSGFLQHMQAAAAHHADVLGFGFDTLQAENRAWVLSRVRIEFERFPKVEETIVIRTWPKRVDRKIMFIRDFELRDKQGDRFGLASTVWLVIDTRTWHLLPNNSLTHALPENKDLEALTDVPQKLYYPNDMSEKYKLTARYSDVDVMGHVNNTRYADWVSDCFDAAVFKEKELKWMQINYIKEVRSKEIVSVSLGHDPLNKDVWLIKGSNATTGSEAFEAALGWRNYL